MTLYYQTDGLLVAKVAKKTLLIDISAIPGGHLNSAIFGRDLGANFLRNGPRNSIPPSKNTS